MSGTTPRFGLSFFGGDTPGALDDDAQKYTSEDRLTIDAVLSALESHNHRIVDNLGDPVSIPDVQLSTAGTLEGGTTYYYVISFVDVDGLETISGPEASISTPDPLPDPEAPQGEAANSTGTLELGTYYYAISGLRGSEESAISEAVALTLVHDEASSLDDNTVTLTLPALDEATSYQIWRQAEDDPGFTRIGTSATGTFVDTGAVPAGEYGDPANDVPVTATGADNFSITVTLTGADLTTLTTSSGWRIYRATESANYSANSLVHEVIERTSETDPDAPLVSFWLDDGDAPLTGSPSARSTQLNVPPFTFEFNATLPAASGYPDNYPTLDSTNTLYVAKAGVWAPVASTAGGATGPTGATGTSGSPGATGPMGYPGLGGGSGGTYVYDSGTGYSPGAIVSTGNGLWINTTSGILTGADPLTSGSWTFLAWIVPAGGSMGQVLTKVSGSDGDYGWDTP